MAKPCLTNKEMLKDLLKSQVYGLEKRLIKIENNLSRAMQEAIKGITEAREAGKEIERRLK